MAVRESDNASAILVRVLATDELIWVYCGSDQDTYLTRTESYAFDLSESDTSEGGFEMSFGGFEFSITRT